MTDDIVFYVGIFESVCGPNCGNSFGYCPASDNALNEEKEKKEIISNHLDKNIECIRITVTLHFVTHVPAGLVAVHWYHSASVILAVRINNVVFAPSNSTLTKKKVTLFCF